MRVGGRDFDFSVAQLRAEADAAASEQRAESRDWLHRLAHQPDAAALIAALEALPDGLRAEVIESLSSPDLGYGEVDPVVIARVRRALDALR